MAGCARKQIFTQKRSSEGSASRDNASPVKGTCCLVTVQSWFPHLRGRGEDPGRDNWRQCPWVAGEMPRNGAVQCPGDAKAWRQPSIWRQDKSHRSIEQPRLGGTLKDCLVHGKGRLAEDYLALCPVVS